MPVFDQTVFDATVFLTDSGVLPVAVKPRLIATVHPGKMM